MNPIADLHNKEHLGPESEAHMWITAPEEVKRLKEALGDELIDEPNE